MSLSIGKTTLQDALQEVPQLLEACALHWFVDESVALNRRSGVRNLRLVCKHTSIIALQAVRGYHLTVSAEPSITEPLLDVARLLKSADLKHLKLDIMAPAGECLTKQIICFIMKCHTLDTEANKQELGCGCRCRCRCRSCSSFLVIVPTI